MKEKKVQWVDSLIDWFQKNKRDLPWRNNKDPYRVWVSEIMLQQTRVAAVISYFSRFIALYPTIQSLAESPLEKLYKAWEGLGYYSRAKNMLETAKIIQNKYAGHFPDSYQELLSLPGIGDYTAGAILSIAFNQAFPAVDGNVLRVLARIYHIQGNILDTAVKKEITLLVRENLPLNSASDYTESIMELGALLCLPKNPKCLVCPIHHFCKAYLCGEQENLPIRIDKTKQTEENLVVMIIKWRNRIGIEKRKAKGLLGGFWQMPNFTIKLDEDQGKQIDNFLGNIGLSQKYANYLFDESHIYSHRIWNMKVYELVIPDDLVVLPENFQWVSLGDISNYPIGGAFRKIINRWIL